MANSSTTLDLIASSQAQKEVTANALFDAASPAMLFGRRASACTGLVWGYYGGALLVDGEPEAIANGTITLDASETNYVEADSDGVVSSNTTEFSAGAIPLYVVVTGSGAVTGYSDMRAFSVISSVNGQTGPVITLDASDVGAEAAGTAAGLIATHEAASNPHPIYLTQTEADALYATIAGGAAETVTTIGALINGATAKTTPVDADYIGLMDSAASNVLKKLSWANIKATLKTYFDTLYAPIAQPFDMHAFYPGIPTASAKVIRVPIARAVTFAANFSGSYFAASANATATTVFDVQKNGSSIGSVSIASSGTTATFTTTSGTSKSFAAGDVLSIIAPGTADATLADVGFVLVGSR